MDDTRETKQEEGRTQRRSKKRTPKMRVSGRGMKRTGKKTLG